VDLNAVLGRGSVFEGKLVFEGTVHINGTFAGEIHSKDTLIIGEGARVEAKIDVGTLIITGEVKGQIRARQLLEMHAPARVNGTILTPTLMIERGVTFEGVTRMENLDAAPAPGASGGAPAKG
jgi:cytoskeletal protein CcmA (bactofilin family)